MKEDASLEDISSRGIPKFCLLMFSNSSTEIPLRLERLKMAFFWAEDIRGAG